MRTRSPATAARQRLFCAVNHAGMGQIHITLVHARVSGMEEYGNLPNVRAEEPSADEPTVSITVCRRTLGVHTNEKANRHRHFFAFSFHARTAMREPSRLHFTAQENFTFEGCDKCEAIEQT